MCKYQVWVPRRSPIRWLDKEVHRRHNAPQQPLSQPLRAPRGAVKYFREVYGSQSYALWTQSLFLLSCHPTCEVAMDLVKDDHGLYLDHGSSFAVRVRIEPVY